MNAYGTETLRPKRRTDICEPDVADIRRFGLAGGGKDYHRGRRASKAHARRLLARAARRAARTEAAEEAWAASAPAWILDQQEFVDAEMADYLLDQEHGCFE